jgi:subtilisin family serine protease
LKQSEAAVVPGPARDQSYPVVGIIDGGVADVASLRPWRAGAAGFIAAADKDEEHGSFIAGLLAGAGALNPDLADRLERVPCRFFDIDLMPRQGLLSRYFRTPDEFFDQLDEQVAKAKAEHGVRIFNMSLGSPAVRQGLGYSTLAAQLDRIAKEHDVIFVVSAGNLRRLAARPPWPPDPDAALQMLATRTASDERITPPGDHLYGCTVAALNPPGLQGAVADVPTTYSRRGPGPGGARKPELCQIGGITARDGNRSGLFSVGVDGNLVDGSGTSYTAPLVAATIGALDHRLQGRARRETLLALPGAQRNTSGADAGQAISDDRARLYRLRYAPARRSVPYRCPSQHHPRVFRRVAATPRTQLRVYLAAFPDQRGGKMPRPCRCHACLHPAD